MALISSSSRGVSGDSGCIPPVPQVGTSSFLDAVSGLLAATEFSWLPWRTSSILGRGLIGVLWNRGVGAPGDAPAAAGGDAGFSEVLGERQASIATGTSPKVMRQARRWAYRS